jgi:alpha-glucuronidase
MWTEVMNWKTFAKGVSSDRAGDVIRYTSANRKYSGYVGVNSVGLDWNWCGHKLSQANLYAFARLSWDNRLTAEDIAREWIELTFHYLGQEDKDKIYEIVSTSRDAYRNYTLSLGGVFMCRSGVHYGVNVEAEEWNGWGTYNRVDYDGFGVDRTVKSGSGMIGQYNPEVAAILENINTCPEADIAFFHHVSAAHRLHSGQTVAQHIYDSHFAGYESVERYKALWKTLEGKLWHDDWKNVDDRLDKQLRNALDWRDKVNSYFYRRWRIPDEKASPSRPLYW